MKLFALLTISIFPAASMALSLGDPCTKKWPQDTSAGKIEMKYRISDSCEPRDVRFLISEPNGEFNDFSMCQIKRVFPYWDPHEPIEAITIEEHRKRIEEGRIAEPEKYHHRAIHAVDSAGNHVTLSCYFNEKWVVTSRTVRVGETVKPVNSDYIESLPEQSFESKFESEL